MTTTATPTRKSPLSVVGLFLLYIIAAALFGTISQAVGNHFYTIVVFIIVLIGASLIVKDHYGPPKFFWVAVVVLFLAILFILNPNIIAIVGVDAVASFEALVTKPPGYTGPMPTATQTPTPTPLP